MTNYPDIDGVRDLFGPGVEESRKIEVTLSSFSCGHWSTSIKETFTVESQREDCLRGLRRPIDRTSPSLSQIRILTLDI